MTYDYPFIDVLAVNPVWGFLMWGGLGVIALMVVLLMVSIFTKKPFYPRLGKRGSESFVLFNIICFTGLAIFIAGLVGFIINVEGNSGKVDKANDDLAAVLVEEFGLSSLPVDAQKNLVDFVVPDVDGAGVKSSFPEFIGDEVWWSQGGVDVQVRVLQRDVNTFDVVFYSPQDGYVSVKE